MEGEGKFNSEHLCDIIYHADTDEAVRIWVKVLLVVVV